MKKYSYWKKAAMMAATAAMLMGSCTPAFAYVSSGTEEQFLTETGDGAGEDISGQAANGNEADAGQGYESTYEYVISFDEMEGFTVKSEGIPERELELPQAN